MAQEDKYIKENNLDEIDTFLFKEFGIMGGACSAQKAFEYHTARMVAEKLWKKKEPVSEELEEMKTVTDYADAYVGHPQEIDEDLSIYQKREAYKAGMNKAFDLIRAQWRKEVEK